MKLAMKLRTRLFLSISALITVALLGLLLGLVSVMQMAGTQEATIRSNFVTLDLGLKLRQTLGDQLVLMLAEKPDPAAFEASKQHYLQLLDEGISQEAESDGRQYGFTQAKADYLSFLQAFEMSRDPGNVLSGNSDLRERFNTLRNGLITEHKHALDNINAVQHDARERALLVSGLLGLVGLAVLIIGFVTAHAIARRFGAPIEALAKAADNIGQGNFEVTLPISSAMEMNQLTKRWADGRGAARASGDQRGRIAGRSATPAGGARQHRRRLVDDRP